MTQPFITEEEVEKALDYLRDNARSAAQAAADRDYLEGYTKVVKAELMADMNDQTIGAQERYAYAHSLYKEHLKARAEAVRKDEEHRFLRTAAQAKIDAWRTWQATERAMKL